MAVKGHGPFEIEYQDGDGKVWCVEHSDFEHALRLAQAEVIEGDATAVLDPYSGVVFEPRSVGPEIHWLLTHDGRRVREESRPFPTQEVLDLYLIGPLGQPDPTHPVHCGDANDRILMARDNGGRWYAQCAYCGTWELSTFALDVPLRPYRATRPTGVSDRGRLDR